MVETIETIAIEYVLARRAKAIARAKRGALHRQCEAASGPHEVCIFSHPDDLCDLCREAETYHAEFLRQSKLAAALLRKMQRQVLKRTAGTQ